MRKDASIALSANTLNSKNNQIPLFNRILILFALCLVDLAACNRRSETGLNPSDFAPDFELQNLSGQRVKLSELRGKVVFLNFWATWCGPCEAEMPGLQSVYERLKGQGFEILAVAVDDQENKVREFVKSYGLTFPVIFDAAGEVRKLYRVSGFPESFVIDRQGKLVLFKDPDDNMPVVRIIGPRDWESSDAIGRLEQLLKKAA